MFDNSEQIMDYKDAVASPLYININKAKEWSEDAIRTIVLPTDTLEELDDAWNDFNSMIKKNRRESDWKSIELFGMTNQEHYEKLRNEFLGKDIENGIESDIIPPVQDGDDPILESYIDLDAADSYYNADAINYTSADVEKAREWSKEATRAIILPTRTIEELENLWDAYNLMVKKHRRESDWMSLELFGITNLKHYEYLKSQFLKEDIKDKDNYDFLVEAVDARNSKDYIIDMAKSSNPAAFTESVIKLLQPNKTVYEELIVNNIVSDALAAYGDGLSPSLIPNIGVVDMPYISPNDMIDMGVYGQSPAENFFGASADNTMLNEEISVKEWFSMYQAANNGFYTEMGALSADWVQKVRQLSYGLSSMIESGAEQDEINARKQSILELGWNPDIEFSNKARSIANEFAMERISKNCCHPSVINLTEFSCINEVTSTSNSKNLKPIYVMMTEGKRLISKVIKAATHSPFSHASISFDHTLTEMYSYAMSGTNGFRKESIFDKEMNRTSRISVYVFFVSERVYDKMRAFIDNLAENPDKTKYSYRNLFTFLFNIPYNDDYKMVCSQFVDRCLKAAEIDVNGLDSSLVSPSLLDKTLKTEPRIYHIYDGVVTKYDANRAEKLTKSLMKTCKPLKEQNLGLITSEASYINAIASNCKNLNALIELREHKNIVTNSRYRQILEEVIFDILDLKPFEESTVEKPVGTSIDFMGSMIRKYIQSI